MTPNLNTEPDIKVSLKQTFGIDSEMEVDAFSKKNEYVPEIDKNYKFDSCLLYTSPSPRDLSTSRMPSSA